MTELPFLDDLRSFGDLKVWSFLVTLFGDLAADDGVELSGLLVSRLSSRLGIKPEALRVALHRLRKDGWIESRREGREARYCLSASARADTTAVHDYVYAAALHGPDRIFLLTHPTVPGAAKGIAIAPRTTLSQTTTPDAIAAPIDPSDLPDWVKEILTPAEQLKSYSSLLSLLAAQEFVAAGNSEDKLIVRLIVLHTWRRIVLRHDALAAALMGNNWVGAECRSAVHRVLHALPRSLVSDLD